MKIAKQTAKKILTILLILFGGLTLLGGSIFTIAMAAAGWDFSVMNTVDYKRETYTEAGVCTTVLLNFNTADIKVYFDESTTQVRVEYAEKYTKHGEKLTQTIITERYDALKIIQAHKNLVYLESSFKEDDDVRVYLPINRAYLLEIETNTGDIFLNGNAHISNLKLTTNTGNVFINNDITATEKANIQTGTGEICIRGSLTAPTVELKANTGDIWLRNLSGETLYATTNTGDVRNYANGLLDFTSLQFKVGTGDVDIRLIGNYTDYCVDVKTTTGDVFLAGYPDESKPKKLTIRTSTGDIRGVYVEK